MLGLCCGMRSQAGGLFGGVPRSHSRPGGGAERGVARRPAASERQAAPTWAVRSVGSWKAFGGLSGQPLGCPLSCLSQSEVLLAAFSRPAAWGSGTGNGAHCPCPLRGQRSAQLPGSPGPRPGQFPAKRERWLCIGKARDRLLSRSSLVAPASG